MLQRGRLRVFFGCPAKLICMFLLEIACVLHAWFPGILWMKATLLLAPPGFILYFCESTAVRPAKKYSACKGIV